MNDEVVNKKRVLIIMIPVFLLIIAAAIFIGSLSNSSQQTIVESQITDQTNENKISINGFSHLYFKANTLEQDVDFTNPSNNKCTMNMSLILDDGTILWSCDDIKPGNTVQKIKLSSALPEGEYYNCALQIRCFNADTGTELNGCNICCVIVAE